MISTLASYHNSTVGYIRSVDLPLMTLIQTNSEHFLMIKNKSLLEELAIYMVTNQQSIFVSLYCIDKKKSSMNLHFGCK